jgi:hypothetical protein
MKSEEDFTKYSPIPSSRSPQDVLKNFVGGLRIPIRTIEDLLPRLSEITTQEDGREIFLQLTQALLITNRNIALVLEYLNTRLKSNIADATDIANQFCVCLPTNCERHQRLQRDWLLSANSLTYLKRN